MTNLAIIIPYYKIDFFEETLQSVAAQSDKRFTLYIGNDASPDDPKKIIEKYFLEGNYHYYNYSENVGGKNLAQQWERILENVTEEWFQILGDDDCISENFVEEFYKNLNEVKYSNSSVIKFSQCWIDENGNPFTSFTHYPKLIDPVENFIHKFIDYHRGSLSEYILKTAKYKKYGFTKFPLAWHSDDYALLQFSKKNPIFFVDKAKLYIRVSLKSISGNQTLDAEKKIAGYQFWGLILNNYHHLLPKDFVLQKVKLQVDYAYKNKQQLNINLFKIFLSLKEYKKIFKLPSTFYYLHQK